MNYKNKKLNIEKYSISNLVNKYGSPVYAYSYEKLKTNILKFNKNFKKIKPLVCFSVKSNANTFILREIKKFGLGADVVSIGELTNALKAGINPKKIVFSGVGKTNEEINFAINKKILLINVESEDELIEIEKIAKKKKRVVNVGIRLNPDIDAKTLKNISTGRIINKFGVTKEIFLKIIKKYKNSNFIKIKCLSTHIGSQIINHRPYEKTLKVIDKIIMNSKHKFDYIDLGGGMGINYKKNKIKFDYKKYSDQINKFLKKHECQIIFEPGRSIIGNTGVLISKIIYVKKTKKVNFIVLDAAMNDFMRPALYNAKHKIIPAKLNRKTNKIRHEFVGPICETTDKFLSLPKYQYLKKNDLVAICDVGAYGMSLASNYNLRLKPAEILIYKSKVKVINKRQKLNNII